MPRKLTEGSIARTVFNFSLPYLLAYFLQTLYGLADLYIAGQFNGADVISAVAIASQIMHMVTVIIIGLAIGSGMYILGIFTTIIVDVIQIIMHKHTIGVDSMRIGRLRCTTSSPDAFRQQLDEYIDSKGMQILDVKIEFSEDGTTAYELTLRMGRDMTISDMSGFLESMDNVKAISFEMENS